MLAARELVEAIDEVLAFVFRRRGLGRGDIPRSEFARFIKLDQTVFRRAKDLDLLDCLPRQDELAAMLALPGKRRVGFEGKTNLPGDWEDDIYMAVGTPKWLQDMNALRSVAESLIQKSSESNGQDGPAINAESADNRVKTKIKGKASINARMLETMQLNSESHGWSAAQWAMHLKCAKSSVVETPTWKDLALVRDRMRAERAADRRQNQRTQPGNRTK